MAIWSTVREEWRAAGYLAAIWFVAVGPLLINTTSNAQARFAGDMGPDLLIWFSTLSVVPVCGILIWAYSETISIMSNTTFFDRATKAIAVLVSVMPLLIVFLSLIIVLLIYLGVFPEQNVGRTPHYTAARFVWSHLTNPLLGTLGDRWTITDGLVERNIATDIMGAVGRVSAVLLLGAATLSAMFPSRAGREQPK